MDTPPLKNPLASYRTRFNRFLWLLVSVKGLKPKNRQLWRVMDGMAFQDTETALETALFNEGKVLEARKARKLVLPAISGAAPLNPENKKRRRAAND
jgi:hypothetical protein